MNTTHVFDQLLDPVVVQGGSRLYFQLQPIQSVMALENA